MFKKKPMCEICAKREATHFSLFRDESDTKGGDDNLKQFGKWKFVCECQDNESHWIEIDKFFKSPNHTIDWMVHINGKYWMNWDNFMEMMRRFRKATDSYWAN